MVTEPLLYGPIEDLAALVVPSPEFPIAPTPVPASSSCGLQCQRFMIGRDGEGIGSYGAAGGLTLPRPDATVCAIKIGGKLLRI